MRNGTGNVLEQTQTIDLIIIAPTVSSYAIFENLCNKLCSELEAKIALFTRTTVQVKAMNNQVKVSPTPALLPHAEAATPTPGLPALA